MMPDWQDKERLARRAIEDRGFIVHDANVLFRANCPNIDLVVFGKTRAIYIQVKSSTKPASKNCVVVDGSPWTEAQLQGNAPLFNKHIGEANFKALLVLILARDQSGHMTFYLAPPEELEKLARASGIVFANRPKRDGNRRSIKFRKELPREALEPWRDAWYLLEEI